MRSTPTHTHTPTRPVCRLYTYQYCLVTSHIAKAALYILRERSSYSPCGLKVKFKGSPYSITECRVPELIPVLGSQPAGDVSHEPGSRLPLLSARPAVTPANLKRAATDFAAW